MRGTGGRAAVQKDAARAGAGHGVPVLVVVAAVAALLFLVLPLVGLVARSPWGALPTVVAAPATVQALRLSLITATISVGIALVLGVPLAWLLARPGLRGAGVLRALVTVPLVLPPVVGGVALFSAFGRTGLLGRFVYAHTGWSLPFTPAAVVFAQVFVALPFLVLSVEGALRGADRRYEDAAATLGAGPFTVFRRITLPLIGPGVVAGAVLAWTRALGEFGATITFAGNLPGRTQTMPLQVYLQLETNPATASLLSVLLLAVSVLVLVVLRGRWAGGW